MRDPRFGRAYGKFDEQLPAATLASVRARALLAAAAVPDKEMLLNEMSWQGDLSPAESRAYKSTLIDTIKADPKKRQVWVASLSSIIQSEIQSHRDDDGVRRVREDWLKRQNPFSAWERRFSSESGLRMVGHLYIVGFALYLLFEIDHRAWVQFLDTFPAPNFAFASFHSWFVVSQDRELLEDLIRTAPPVLSPNGEWLEHRPIAGLLIVPQIIAHAERLIEAIRHTYYGTTSSNENAELESVTKDELPNWMRSAFRIVLDRADGHPLLVGYLAHLYGVPAMSHRRHEPWDARDCARRILAEELASRKTTVQFVRTVWNRSSASAPDSRTEASTTTSGRFSEHEGEGARGSSGHGGDYLYAAAMIAEASSSLPAEITELWQFLEDRLLARDYIFRYFLDREYHYDATRLFARLFARLPVPGEALQRLYRQLEPQRRRAMYGWRYEGEYNVETSSQFTIQLGQFLCQQSNPWGTPAQHHDLFWWLYDAARRLWLTSAWSLLDSDRYIVANFFSFLPAVFGENLQDALARALAPIRNDAWIVSMAGACLWRNGIEAQEVARLFQSVGVHLPTALRDAHQWASISENRQDRVDPATSAFPAVARDLAKALHIVFETDLPLPQRPSAKNEFHATLPWAAALWKSLERDGMTNIRVHLLAAQTWLLQATVPDSFRQRFGLSPDIRILAVHGQLVGRDVRLAMAKPNDADAIDPDLLVVVCDHPDFAQRLAQRIPGPFGQRIPWIPLPKHEFPPLHEIFLEHTGKLDLFEYRDPVHGNALAGRHREIDELTRRLSRGEAVGVFGLRKVGKSSMMEAVAQRLDPIGARLGMFRFYGTELPENASPSALVVSFDAQNVGAKSLSNLVSRLLDHFEERLQLAGLRKDVRDYFHDADPLDRFRYRLAMALERQPLPICFMIDEYDLLFAGYNGEGGLPGIERLFALLRAEANASRRVSLALVGRDPAFVDQPHIGGITNPLLDWVHHQYLGPLRRTEAEELLVRLGKRVGLEVGAQSLGLAWQWSGGHPLLLRQFGSIMFDLAHSPGTRPRPAPTDPISLDTIEVFPTRNAVRTICGEIETLLAVRFKESWVLLQALASVAATDTNRAIFQNGGMNSHALRVLMHFGIVQMDGGVVWVPEIFRHAFGVALAQDAHEVAGEE